MIGIHNQVTLKKWVLLSLTLCQGQGDPQGEKWKFVISRIVGGFNMSNLGAMFSLKIKEYFETCLKCPKPLKNTKTAQIFIIFHDFWAHVHFNAKVSPM